jgi:hypothetical protein
MPDRTIEQSFSEQERLEAQMSAEHASRDADLKQHADKLIQGFEEIDVPASHRAIWELVQNACDLSAECRVIIDYSGGGFTFSHNGKPFLTTTLISLIKQVSSKYDGEEIGRFGTGFITTHAFGRKFIVNSLLEVKGKYIRIENFCIDRTPKEWKGMAANLRDQEEKVYELIRKGTLAPAGEGTTSFTYLPATPIERKYIADSYRNLHEYIPIVLAVNERLVEIIVKDAGGKQVTYRKGGKKPEDDSFVTTIEATSGPVKLFSLQDEEGEVEVILPLKDKTDAYTFSDNMAKLFLYYPLIGTERWGCNFIIHSKKFSPTEHRDGIHLKSETEQVQQAEAANRKLINKASKLIFDYVRKYSATVGNPICLAKIAFPVYPDKPLLTEYFTDLKTSWIEIFKDCPLVEKASGNIRPSGAVFLADELVADEFYAGAIYSIASKFWSNLPKKEVAGAWTSTLQEWGGSAVTYKETKDLVAEVHKTGTLKAFDKDDLKTFFSFLIGKGHSGFFGDHGLLPNIQGDLRPLGSLNNRINLPQELLDIADVIAPGIPQRLINPEFSFSFTLTLYDRKAFCNEVNGDIVKQIGDKPPTVALADNFLEKMLQYCRISPTLESTSIPISLFKCISGFYGKPETPLVIATVKDDEIDVRSAQRAVARMFLSDVSKKDSKWVLEHITLLERVISLGATYADYQEMFAALPLYPNRLYELCPRTSLKVDVGISDEIKRLYDDVIPHNKPIDASFVHPLFARHLPDAEKRNARSLTEKIEESLAGDSQYANINEHPKKEVILQIVKRITSDEEWAKLFPLLSNRRANVMLDRVTDEEIKDNVFAIISLEDKEIKLLGNLVQTGKMDEIISLGTAALDDQQKENSDFAFKTEIGKRLENLIRERLGHDLKGVSVEVTDVQNGQDIVVYKHKKEFFYIEVKSRWSSDSSVMMSRNQFMKASSHPENYSLCCIDMSDYKVGLPDRYQVSDVAIIFNRIKILNHVGEALLPLMEGILKNADLDNEITLVGDYKATIPQSMIKTGGDLNALVSHVLAKLNSDARLIEPKG